MLKNSFASNISQLMIFASMPLVLLACGGGGATANTETQGQAPQAVPAAALPAQPEKIEEVANNLLAVTTSRHFYVSPAGSDSNPGSKAAPFRTITRASQAAGPDSMVHVAAGTYSGDIETNTSGTENGRIYYVSDIKWGAKIVPPANGLTSNAWLVSGSNVTINGFDIDGSALPATGFRWRIGILTRSSNVVVENNHIHHIANRMSDCVSAGAGGGVVGDSAFGGKNITMDRNLVHDIGVKMSCPYFHGLYMSTSGTIKNNLIHSVGYGGVHLWRDADHVNIINNTIFNSPKAILVGTGGRYFLVTPGDYINVANNILVDNGYGIIEESDGSGNGSHNTYVNNLYFRNNVNEAISGQNRPNARGSIVADPLFVNYDINGNGDYHLKSGSPAIDKGSPIDNAVTDFNGTARTRGSAEDIGAFEF